MIFSPIGGYVWDFFLVHLNADSFDFKCVLHDSSVLLKYTHNTELKRMLYVKH